MYSKLLIKTSFLPKLGFQVTEISSTLSLPHTQQAAWSKKLTGTLNSLWPSKGIIKKKREIRNYGSACSLLNALTEHSPICLSRLLKQVGEAKPIHYYKISFSKYFPFHSCNVNLQWQLKNGINFFQKNIAKYMLNISSLCNIQDATSLI